MATGTIVKAWQDSTNAYVAIRVTEGGSVGNVEYFASTPLVDAQGNAKPAAQVRSELLAAASVQRNAQLATPAPLAGLSGTVTI